ncbi:MAG: hypothetical protein Q9209_006482 [Squamulea sp. 1 TL-2023]
MSPAVETSTSASTSSATATTKTDKPTSSPLPIKPSPETTPSACRPYPKPGHPTCTLRIECRDLSHDGADVFFTNNEVSRDLLAAVTAVLSILYKPSQSNPHIPGTRSVTLVLRPMEGVAYTIGSELDNDHKEIHFSLDYISKIPSEPQSRQRNEIQGVMVHEMVHCWQWNGDDTAPGGLTEGIADFVRLKAGLSPPHWKKERKENWDGGYQHTGYFLDWIEGSYGEGSVRRVNEALMNKRYDEEAFWMGLFGKQVKDLWDEYCETMPKEEAVKNKQVEQGSKDEKVVGKEKKKTKDYLEKVLD